MKTLGLIPARSGSKGIPGKNLKQLAGIPLIVRTVSTAAEAHRLDRIVVSTDSEEIAAAAREAGAEVPFMRPNELATDEAGMLAVVEHALDEMSAQGFEPDVIVLLQPTAALRTPGDIDAALDMMEAGDCDSVVSVVEVPESYNPYWMLSIEGGVLRDVVPGGRDIVRRQDLPPAYIRDGTIYATRASVIRGGSLYGSKSRALVVPAERSVNLDTMEDWARAEAILAGG